MQIASGSTAPAEAGPRITCIWQGPDGQGTRLGECPIWDGWRERLFWIDSLGGKIWSARADGSDPRDWALSEEIGSIGLCEDGRLISGLEGGFAFITLHETTVTLERLGDPDPGQPDTRLNDGKVDRQGRFWCGTMNTDFAAPNSALFRLDPDLSWTRIDDGFTVSNGIAFSPDGRSLYFSDSRVDRSYQYDLDPETGNVSARRAFVDTSRYEGRIDGATVDAGGHYWGALFHGNAVARFSPDGSLLQSIAVPVSYPTMCSFGGPDMDVLYVTSATFPLTREQLSREPLAGGLFAIEGLGFQGLEEPRFRIAQ